MTCVPRTAYYRHHPEHAIRNGVPVGNLPHAFGSRVRRMVNGVWSDWSPLRCSWCGESKTVVDRSDTMGRT